MSGTLQQKMEAIAAAGFDGIELFEPDFVHFSGSAATLRRLADDHGLSIDLYQPFRDLEGMPTAHFRRSLARAEYKFALMNDLGCRTLLVCSNTSPLSTGEPERAAAQLYELAERAARHDIRIGYEALAWGRHVRRYRDAWKRVALANHPHLGLILDSFHTLSLQDDPTDIAELPGDKIFFLQMADAPQLQMDVLQWARHFRNFPGQGQLDCEHFFEQILKSGYEGPLSLEIFNDQFRETPNRRTATDAMRSLLWLESRVRSRLEASGACDRLRRQPATGTWLFKPPPVPELTGVAFVEFAVDHAHAEALGAVLATMGFRLVGQHRSKDVQLYAQGDIHLVVNAEPDSFASQRFERQGGPGMCAIGLGTSVPDQAAARASALLSAAAHTPRQADELHIPAVVSPGGMRIHFVPTERGTPGFEIADFHRDGSATDGSAAGAHRAAGATSLPAGHKPAPVLRSLDHIALALPPDQLDSWVLFSRAVLGLEPGDRHELADPYGLVQSSSVSNAARSVRMVMNVSASRRTGVAHAVSASGGSGGLHHLAFACDDIFAAVEQLRASGTQFVPISPNYYDDLLARCDLDPSLVGRMQSLGILFDQTPLGAFFHIYTIRFANRFFFEIVQRVGGYDGYGALNGAARLASEAQAAEALAAERQAEGVSAAEVQGSRNSAN
jgi:4-hydroxyphenylpyruvate dioxygenase